MNIKQMINENGEKQYAYVMLLMINEDYIPGALILAESLRNIGCLADLVIMIDETISIEAQNLLKKLYDKIILIDKIKIDNKDIIQKYLITKINGLKLNYKKIALIDIDAIIFENSNQIFEYETPACIYDTKYNSGLILLEPNNNDYEKLLELSKLIPFNETKPLIYLITLFYKKLHKIDDKYLKSNNIDNAWGIQYNNDKPFIIKNKIPIEIRITWPHFKLWFLYFRNLINKYQELYNYKCLHEVIELSKYYLSFISRYRFIERNNRKHKLKKQVRELYNINTNTNLDYYHLNIGKEYDSDNINFIMNDYTTNNFIKFLKDKTNILDSYNGFNYITNINQIFKIVDSDIILNYILSEFIKLYPNVFVILVIKEENDSKYKLSEEFKKNLIFKKKITLMGMILKNILFNIYQNNIYQERIQILGTYNDYKNYNIDILIYQTIYPFNIIETNNEKILIFNDTNSKVRLSSILFNQNTLSRFIKKKITIIKNNKINRNKLENILFFQTIKKWLYNNYSGNELSNLIVIKYKPLTILDCNKHNLDTITNLTNKKIKIINLIFHNNTTYNKYNNIIKNINNPKYYWELEGIKIIIDQNFN
jgi:hypothetical protein